jgi:hypothetical protein
MLVRSNPLDLVALLNLSKAQSCTGCNADVGEHGDSGHQCATAETDGMTKLLENGKYHQRNKIRAETDPSTFWNQQRS